MTWAETGTSYRIVVRAENGLGWFCWSAIEVAPSSKGGEPTANAKWDDLDYLARKHSPLYIPSASVYLEIANSKRKAKYDVDLLALGDPVFAEDSGLRPLPHTRTEVLAISAGLEDDKKRVFLGDEATEAKQHSQSAKAPGTDLATTPTPAMARPAIF